MESQNHLLDLVDSKYISEDTRKDLSVLAEAALQEVTGLMEYLQSPDALRNARRARERRIASRQDRRGSGKGPNKEPRTENTEPEPEPEPEPNPEHERERSTENREE
jgi:hypothetical protein